MSFYGEFTGINSVSDLDLSMARAPFNVLVFPYRLTNHGLEYAIFNRADAEEDFWQGLSGGGEDRETPLIQLGVSK